MNQNKEWTGWDALTPLLRYANFYDATPGEGFGPRYISDFQILYVQSGEGEMFIDDAHFTLKTGDITHYGPNQRHQVVSSTRAPLRLLGLHFLYLAEDARGLNAATGAVTSDKPFEFDGGMPACPLNPTPPAVIRPRLPDTMRKRVESLVLSYITSPRSRSLEKRGLLLQMMEALHDAILDRSLQSVRHPAVNSACAAIERDLSAEQGVEFLADISKLSADHFGRLFKEQTGLTVRQYVRERRLIKARRLLVEGHLNISEVARAVGYDDPFYFSRIFHAEFGVAPSRFRYQYPFV